MTWKMLPQGRTIWKIVFGLVALIGIVYLAIPMFAQARQSNNKGAAKRTAPAGSPQALRLQRLQQLQHEGSSALAQNNLSAAEAKFRAILLLEPHDAVGWKGLGITLERQGRFGQALDAYKLLVSDQPKWGSTLAWNVTFLTHYAELCEAHGRPQDALFAYSRILDRGNNHMGDWSPKVPREVATVEEAKARAKTMAGIAQIGKRAYGLAESLFQRAIQIDPWCAQAHFYLGVAYDDQEKYQQAKDEFQRAKQASGDRADILAGIKRMTDRKYWIYDQ